VLVQKPQVWRCFFGVASNARQATSPRRKRYRASALGVGSRSSIPIVFDAPDVVVFVVFVVPAPPPVVPVVARSSRIGVPPRPHPIHCPLGRLFRRYEKTAHAAR